MLEADNFRFFLPRGDFHNRVEWSLGNNDGPPDLAALLLEQCRVLVGAQLRQDKPVGRARQLPEYGVMTAGDNEVSRGFAWPESGK